MYKLLDLIPNSIASYVYITIGEPIEQLRKLGESTHAKPNESTSSPCSFFSILRKQRENCSPEINDLPIERTIHVKDYYWKSLKQSSRRTRTMH